MKISVWEYLAEYEFEREELIRAVDDVFRSGRLILDKNVANFEAEFSGFCGVKHGIGVANGTDALFLALKAFGIGSNDEVVTVANTAIPTVSAIVSAGAKPRFVDVEPSTFLISVEKIEKTINKNTRCILPVHLYGQCVHMDEIQRIADQYGLIVIEDCAQAHGARYHSRRAGSMSDAAAFSFYPTKILGTYGDGGMVVTDNTEVAARLRRLRSYGVEKRYCAEEHGYNSRLDELHAAILRKKLPRLNSYIEKRRLLARRYDDYLDETSLILPAVATNSEHAYYLYVCRHPERDRIISELRKQEIFLNTSYRWPIHLMEGYKHLGYKIGDLPNTERICREVFSLPMFPTLSFERQDTVIRALQELC